jgi:hypothetical protein
MQSPVALILMLLAIPAWAQSPAVAPARSDWSIVTGNDEVTYYVDFISVRDNGDFRRTWELDDFTKRRYKGGLSLRSFWEGDCRRNRKRYLQLTFFSENMARGEVISASSLTSEWENIVPGSAGEVLLRAICSRF